METYVCSLINSITSIYFFEFSEWFTLIDIYLALEQMYWFSM